ncbi:hypothetical protein [Novipirellula rosea]|uniref:Uncharacterized protein n=1 Tax=Novipirellula rosea TaxID=1031540 RepID=A0ABP8N024_9BACT
MTVTEFVTTVLASASVSAALSASLVWLAKSWIGERIKGAIQHEYSEKLESYKAKLDVARARDIEQLKSEFGENSAERNARRDYEYDARKKLYAEYEPLLFQLIEQSENAYYRVLSLARTAREGDLSPEGGGWLKRPGYYMRSTIYKLLAPIALFKIIQRNLTFVDLSVDPGISANYTLAKALYLTFTCDFELAGLSPAIKYEPHAANAKSCKNENPRQFWRQGIPLGCLDNVLHDCMLTKGQPLELRTFGDFERVVEDLTRDEGWHDVCLFFEVFENFHPLTRPVLWRLLVTQAHIHRLLIGRVGARSDSPLDEILSNLSLPPSEHPKFYWGESATNDPFDVATSFLREYTQDFKVN